MKPEDKLRLGKKLREEANFDFERKCYTINITKAYKIIDAFVEIDSLNTSSGKVKA